MKEKLEVLYICHDRILMAGAVYSLIAMMEATKDFVTPVILIRKGIVYNELHRKGYECITYPFQLNLKRRGKYTILLFLRQILDDIINSLCCYYVRLRLFNRHVSIVHSNSASVSIGPHIAKLLCAKHIWHIREFLDLDFGTSPSKGWDKLKKQIYNSDYVIAITKAIYEHWHLENCRNSVVLFNAVRSIHDVQCIESKDKFFLFCSTSLSDNKGADFAVELFCKSDLYKEGYRLKLIGRYDLKYKQKLETIAIEYDQCQYIDFLGYQNNIKSYMLKASAFLMCSLYEAMGRVTVEALFYGCPVLGHNTGGTKEIITDGVSGYLYDTMDEAVFKLRKIAVDNLKNKEIISNGMELAKTSFSKEFYGNKVLSIYNYVIEDK